MNPPPPHQDSLSPGDTLLFLKGVAALWETLLKTDRRLSLAESGLLDDAIHAMEGYVDGMEGAVQFIGPILDALYAWKRDRHSGCTSGENLVGN